MRTFLKDMLVAVRSLRRVPGFAAATIAVLALGIGAPTAIFSVVEGVLLRPLPFPEPDRVVQVRHVGESGSSQPNVSYPNYLDLRDQSDGLQAMSAYQLFAATVSGLDGARRVDASVVTEGFFEVLGVQPAVGRSFLPEEIGTTGASSVVVGHEYWRVQLNGQADLSDATLRLGERTYAVVGVMPPGFSFPPGAELWLPSDASLANQTRTGHNFQVVGRLRDGVTFADARSELSAIARRLKARYGEETWMADVEIVSLREELVGRLRPALTLLLGAAGLLLLMACANVVNLLMVRRTARRREIAVRLALGAGRGRIAAHRLAETLVLSVAGGALGVLLAMVGLRALLTFEPGGLPRLGEVGVNGAVLLFTVGVSGLSSLVLAMVSMSTRGDTIGMSLADLQGAGPGGGGLTFRPRRLLAASQVALSLVLLIGAGLLGRSFLRLLEVDPGYRTGGVLVVDLWSPSSEGGSAEQELAAFHEELEAQLRGLPGVEEVGGVNVFPLDGGGSNGTFVIQENPDEIDELLGGADTFEEIFGDPELLARLQRMMNDPERTGSAQFRVASTGYFRTMGIALVRGRLFEAQDGPDAPHVAVVSRSLAEARWPGEDPLGKLIQYGNMDGDLRPFTIVGVVGDVRERSLEVAPEPTFYANARQRPGSTSRYHVVLRSDGDEAGTMTAARRIAAGLEPDVAVRFRTVEQVFSTSLAPRRFSLLLLGVFAGTALLLAVMAIYGTVSYLASQRTREIGIRMALGATRAAVRGLVVRQGLAMAGVGVVVGLLAGSGLGSAMRSTVYEVTPLDPTTYVVAVVTLLVVTVVASWIPAARAAAVEPTRALKSE